MHLHVVDMYAPALFDQLPQLARSKDRTIVHTHYAQQDGFGQVGVECAVLAAIVAQRTLRQLAANNPADRGKWTDVDWQAELRSSRAARQELIQPLHMLLRIHYRQRVATEHRRMLQAAERAAQATTDWYARLRTLSPRDHAWTQDHRQTDLPTAVWPQIMSWRREMAKRNGQMEQWMHDVTDAVTRVQRHSEQQRRDYAQHAHQMQYDIAEARRAVQRAENAVQQCKLRYQKTCELIKTKKEESHALTTQHEQAPETTGVDQPTARKTETSEQTRPTTPEPTSADRQAANAEKKRGQTQPVARETTGVGQQAAGVQKREQTTSQMRRLPPGAGRGAHMTKPAWMTQPQGKAAHAQHPRPLLNQNCALATDTDAWCMACGGKYTAFGAENDCTCTAVTTAQQLQRRIVAQRGTWEGECYTFSVLWQMRPAATVEALSAEAKGLREQHHDYLGEHLLGPQQQEYVAAVLGVQVLTLYLDTGAHTLTAEAPGIDGGSDRNIAVVAHQPGHISPFGERRLYTRSEVDHAVTALGHRLVVTQRVPQRTAAVMAKRSNKAKTGTAPALCAAPEDSSAATGGNGAGPQKQLQKKNLKAAAGLSQQLDAKFGWKPAGTETWLRTRLKEMDVEASQMATAELLADAKECGVTDGLVQRERQNLAARSDKRRRDDEHDAQKKARTDKRPTIRAGDEFHVAAWNAQRMSKTQIQFVDSLNYDVVFLLETHDSLNGLQDYGGKNRLLTAGNPPSHDKPGAVGARLSERAAACLDTWGVVPGTGTRAIWLQMRTNDKTPLLLIGTYVPPDYRCSPNQSDIHRALLQFITTRPKRMRILLTGDFNAQMIRSQTGVTGAEVMKDSREGMTTRKALASERLHKFAESARLWAVSTSGQAQQRRAADRGTWRLPGVNDKGEIILVQIDYTFTNKALKDQVLKVHNRWGPSLLRHGREKYDHAMQVTTLRLKMHKSQPQVDTGHAASLYRQNSAATSLNSRLSRT